jgi:molecular chaperone DnaJ
VVEGDYYELLGVPRSADDAAIKAAYRRLAKECHPDRHNGCANQEARFKSINEAYDVLKDPQKRAAYDRFGKAAFQNGGAGGNPFGGGAGFEGFSDIFSTIFGEFMDPRGQRQNAARGADLRYDLEMSLEEAFGGASKTITIEALAKCDSCEGRGSRGSAQAARCGTCGGAGKVRALIPAAAAGSGNASAAHTEYGRADRCPGSLLRFTNRPDNGFRNGLLVGDPSFVPALRRRARIAQQAHLRVFHQQDDGPCPMAPDVHPCRKHRPRGHSTLLPQR